MRTDLREMAAADDRPAAGVEAMCSEFQVKAPMRACSSEGGPHGLSHRDRVAKELSRKPVGVGWRLLYGLVSLSGVPHDPDKFGFSRIATLTREARRWGRRSFNSSAPLG
jgi:hypothetical protein